METSEKKDTTPAIQDVLKALGEKNPDGGEININSIEKQLPNMTRSDIIQQLRKSNAGVFVTGRRGKPSRFVYGAAAVSLLHQAPQRQHRVLRQETSENPEDGSSSLSHGIELRVNVGGQQVTIPIKLELGVAA